MILFTVNDRYVGEAVKRLKAEDIDFELQEVGNGRTNIFFGRSECIEVVRRMITRPLQQLSPEEDFILGALLGYDICREPFSMSARLQNYSQTVSNSLNTIRNCPSL